MHEARNERFWNGSLSRKTDIHPRTTLFEDSGSCRFRVNLFVKFRPRKRLQSLRMVWDRHEDSAAHVSATGTCNVRSLPETLDQQLGKYTHLACRMLTWRADDIQTCRR